MAKEHQGKPREPAGNPAGNQLLVPDQQPVSLPVRNMGEHRSVLSVAAQVGNHDMQPVFRQEQGKIIVALLMFFHSMDDLDDAGGVFKVTLKKGKGQQIVIFSGKFYFFHTARPPESVLSGCVYLQKEIIGSKTCEVKKPERQGRTVPHGGTIWYISPVYQRQEKDVKRMEKQRLSCRS